MPTRVRGSEGIELKKDSIRVDHIQVDSTTFAEVKQEFAPIDSKFDDPRLFWGRWVSSSFGVVAGMMWGFGPEEQADGSARLWHTFDLFVTFDQNGVVRSKKVIQDKDAALLEQLRELGKELDLPPVTTTIQAEPGENEESVAFFTPTEVQLSSTRKRKGAAMKYGPDLHIALQGDFQGRIVLHPDTYCYAATFTDARSGLRRKNHFCVTPIQLISLVRLLDSSGTPVVMKK